MTMSQRIGKTEVLHTAAAIAAILVLGFGTAAAAINVAPQEDINPAMRPLTIGRSIHVQPAFGPDDEDCVWAVHRVTLANGKTKVERQLSCDD